ncbi:hypothetical protein AruPA_05500 [Acidiphilium sp. PA]|uniref:hypothetical protein n=1 Tax=Acidiphilium sp. PA TaxID=2871705 RepID=UPI002244D94C|nr:hypothetical protein [Acidiphilium sp. PA]MCW8306484.1 hypothetical protein [Acidiphilium sp. PA]
MAQVRARILGRARQPLTDDPAVTLHTSQDGSVTIQSRAAVPGYLSPDPRDRRTLGVKIKSLKAGDEMIPLDHPALTRGWHGVEADGRWTDGRAIIPAALAKDGPVTIALAATTRYPVPQSARSRATGTGRAGG